MRRDRLIAACVAMIGVAAVPDGAHAQSKHDRELQELRSRMDSLAPVLSALRFRDSVHHDSMYKSVQPEEKLEPIDSAQVGPFKIVGTSRAVSGSAKEAADAWAYLRPLFSGAEDEARTVQIFAAVNGVPRNIAPRIRPNDAVVGYVKGRDDSWEYGYRRAMGLVLTRRLPASVRGWLTSEGIGTAQRLDWVYRAIALPIPMGEDGRDVIKDSCVNGDLKDCRSLLGIEAPFHPNTDLILRASFITYVVEHAQPGAVAASTADTSSLIPALERLGGAPLDKLIGEWRTYVIAERPRGFAGFGRELTTLFWVAVCAALASRSTRWRLG